MPRQISKETTRIEIIDPQLEKTGWYLHNHSKMKIKIPVDDYDVEPWNGVMDYTFYRKNGEAGWKPNRRNTIHFWHGVIVCKIYSTQP